MQIQSAKYLFPIPEGDTQQPVDAEVIAALEDGTTQQRRANDDIGDGGMAAYVAAGGAIEPYVAPAPTDADVERVRDQRMIDNFYFKGIKFQFGPDSRENIMGAANLATIALTLGGVDPNNMFWHGGSEPFVFLSEDNTPVPLNAAETVEFGKWGAQWRSQHIFAGRNLKDMSPIPDDYATNDAYWPQPPV